MILFLLSFHTCRFAILSIKTILANTVEVDGVDRLTELFNLISKMFYSAIEK